METLQATDDDDVALALAASLVEAAHDKATAEADDTDGSPAKKMSMARLPSMASMRNLGPATALSMGRSGAASIRSMRKKTMDKLDAVQGGVQAGYIA